LLNEEFCIWGAAPGTDAAALGTLRALAGVRGGVAMQAVVTSVLKWLYGHDLLRADPLDLKLSYSSIAATSYLMLFSRMTVAYGRVR
jgi:hypothetical protein